MNTGPETLARVREYREAARAAVEADAPYNLRCLALMDLAEAARAEPDAVIRHWAEAAIWQECRAFLGMADEDSDFPPASYEAAQRRLRRMGRDRCPECRGVIATEEQLGRWSRSRLAEAEARDARKARTE